MRVLLTGDRGRIGLAVRARLEAAGHEVTGFDAAAGDEIRDPAAVAAAAQHQNAIVHLAGQPDDRSGAPEEIMAVNLLGTYHVLRAARAAGVERVVYASSGKALGMLERAPCYLPVDDAHPGLPARAYGLSKWLSEEMCEAFTTDTGIATICLRPVRVLLEADWRELADTDELPPAPTQAAWHLCVFVDLDDTAAAFAAAVECPGPGHVRALICADDIAAERPSAELAAEHLPEVPWRDGHPYEPASRQALIDCRVAHEVLGWQPTRGWDHRLAAGRDMAGADQAR